MWILAVIFGIILWLLIALAFMCFMTYTAAKTVTTFLRANKAKQEHIQKVAMDPQTSLLRSSSHPLEVKDSLLRPSEETTAATSPLLRVPAMKQEAPAPEAEQ